eukprot:362866-Chlamydomonas_euryale.AAC.20
MPSRGSSIAQSRHRKRVTATLGPGVRAQCYRTWRRSTGLSGNRPRSALADKQDGEDVFQSGKQSKKLCRYAAM